MVTNDNYFSVENQQNYMSVSQFKAFEKCQAQAVAELRGEYVRTKSVSMLVGSYVDAYFEGSLDVFKQQNPEIFKRDGSFKSEYIQAEKIIERISRDNLFMEYMNGEKQVVMTGTIEGVPVKIKVDSLHDDKIVDLKIMKDFEPIYMPEQGRLPWFEAWRYDLQGAVYQEIVRQNTGKKLPFFLAAATKEKATDIDVVHISQELLDFELDTVRKNIQMYDAIKQGVFEPIRCGKCDYCKETKVLTVPTETEDFINE